MLQQANKRTDRKAGAPETTKGRGGSLVLGGNQCRRGRRHPPPKFWAVGESSSCQKFSSKNANFEAEKLILGKFRVKIEIVSTHMVSSVGHLQLSVEILWEIFSVRRKIANSCPAYFFNPRRKSVL